MSDLRSLLQQGDPIRREGEISSGDVSRMRQEVLSTRVPTARGMQRSLTAALATGLFLAVVALGWLVEPDSPRTDAQPIVEPRRQLQISAPGGTRVIWIFNPQLDVR